MRIVVGLIATGLLLAESGATRPMSKAYVSSTFPVAASSATTSRVDFDTQLKPIFKSKCMPCHFEGGKMYEELPFDRPETIRKLGDRLFTRIKEENDRRMIREFLDQSP